MFWYGMESRICPMKPVDHPGYILWNTTGSISIAWSADMSFVESGELEHLYNHISVESVDWDSSSERERGQLQRFIKYSYESHYRVTNVDNNIQKEVP